MTNTEHPRLTWSLVIVTYKRAYVLPQCIQLACLQSRPPREVIVVDASPDWEQCRSVIQAQLLKSHSDIQLIYVAANRASIPAQRNQGIDLASSDIVFLIDDDALMHQDCAKEIMAVYEADPDEAVVGVQASLDTALPAEVDRSAYATIRYDGVVDGSFGRSRNPLHRFGHRLLSAEDFIVRYDSPVRAKPMPAAISRMAVAQAEVLAGMRMTFRRRIISEVRFEEVLHRYAAYEDFDASLRASRRGLLLTSLRARVCHLKTPGGGRLSRRDLAYIGSVNWAVLLRLNCQDPNRAEREYRRKLLQNAMVDLVRDVFRRRWSVPHFRGRVAGLRMLRRIFRCQPDELREWYKTHQEAVFGK